MYKCDLRKIYKLKRNALTYDEINVFEKKIYQEIYQYDFTDIENVHIFLKIEKQKEINTYPIISHLRAMKKNVVISKSDFTNCTLSHFLFEKNTKLILNKYGIPEPENGKIINVKDIDLVFVPLLISDKQNYRVGYGKGFYDRFLNACMPQVKTVGLNFFKPIAKITDTNEFDFQLQKVIYPK